MVGLIFLAIIVVYLGIVIAAPFIARRIAKAFNAPPAAMKWAGLGGFLAVTLPIFWDWIPTVVAHNHYCKQDAGVFIYKTVEQWKTENPGVAETLTYDDRRVNSERLADGNRYVLNERIAWETHNTKVGWGISRREEAVIDRKDGAVLAQFRNYSTAVNGSLVHGGSGLRDWKLWMSYRTCEADEQKEPNFNKFRNLMNEFSKLGRTK